MQTSPSFSIVGASRFLDLRVLCRPVTFAFALMVIGVTGKPQGLHADDDPIYWGNDFFLGNGTGNSTINTTNTLVGLRFTATETVTVNEVAFRVGSVAGSGTAKAIVTLRADNGGIPGTVLATTAAISSLPANGHILSALTSSYSVQAGTVYHLIIEGVDVDASNSFTVGYYHTGGYYVNSLTTGHPDASQGRIVSTNGGTSWAVSGQSGAGSTIIAMGARNSSTGKTVGQVATSFLTGATVGGAFQMAENFVYTGLENYGVDTVTLKLRNGVAGNPITSDLTVRLLDSENTVLGESAILASSVISTTFGDYTASFDERVKLELGQHYQLLLLSSGSATGSYSISTPTTGLAGYNDGTFEGEDSYVVRSINGGSSFDTYLNSDITFRFEMRPIPEPATVMFLLGAGAFLLISRKP